MQRKHKVLRVLCVAVSDNSDPVGRTHEIIVKHSPKTQKEASPFFYTKFVIWPVIISNFLSPLFRKTDKRGRVPPGLGNPSGISSGICSCPVGMVSCGRSMARGLFVIIILLFCGVACRRWSVCECHRSLDSAVIKHRNLQIILY